MVNKKSNSFVKNTQGIRLKVNNKHVYKSEQHTVRRNIYHGRNHALNRVRMETSFRKQITTPFNHIYL